MDLDRIEELIRLVRESTASEMAIDTGDYRLTIRRQTAPPVPAPVASIEMEAIPMESAPYSLPLPEHEPVAITAPMVGIFRHPGTPLEAGMPIEVGQVVGSIEVMKLANEITSEWDGALLRVLVEDGQPVEYGQPLMELIPAQALATPMAEEAEA